MKKSLYALVGVSLVAINTANAAINPNGAQINQGLVTTGNADQVIQRWIVNIMMFLGLIAILYGLWGGFNILTAGENEDKVKNGKTIIINALIGIVVIFLVGSVVSLLLNVILT